MSSDPDKPVDVNASAWLENLAARIDAIGEVETIHFIVDQPPRVREHKGGSLVPIEDFEPLDGRLMDAVIETLAHESIARALEQNGEAEFPLDAWQPQAGKIWICQIFLANQGERRVILRRISDVSTWLEDR